ncbi:MAG: RNA-binding S4 domain-containing protein [Candidatus Izimaplasma sp.]|nr:RNA-binding S4 domain-containing protein [Candidatus Izimaplasma bacterium]
MRLDKYLKVSRIIKRRTIAKQIADNERIDINGHTAKSSTSVEVDDIITIHFGNKVVKVKVLEIKDSTKKKDAQKMFDILEEKYL